MLLALQRTGSAGHPLAKLRDVHGVGVVTVHMIPEYLNFVLACLRPDHHERLAEFRAVEKPVIISISTPKHISAGECGGCSQRDCPRPRTIVAFAPVVTQARFAERRYEIVLQYDAVVVQVDGVKQFLPLEGAQAELQHLVWKVLCIGGAPQ